MRNNYGPRWFTHWTAGISWFLTLLALVLSWIVFQHLPAMIPRHGPGSTLMPKEAAWFLWPWFMGALALLSVLPYLLRDAERWMIAVWSMGFAVVCMELVYFVIHVFTLWRLWGYAAVS